MAEGLAETGINAAEDEVEEGGRKLSCDNVMVLTWGQSVECGQQTTPQHLQTAGPDRRSQIKMIGGQEYAAPVSFDNVLQEDIRSIATMPWFSHQKVLAEATNDVASFERYAWDGDLFCGINIDARSS